MTVCSILSSAWHTHAKWCRSWFGMISNINHDQHRFAFCRPFAEWIFFFFFVVKSIVSMHVCGCVYGCVRLFFVFFFFFINFFFFMFFLPSPFSLFFPFFPYFSSLMYLPLSWSPTPLTAAGWVGKCAERVESWWGGRSDDAVSCDGGGEEW
jgi:hypothetical protein